MRIDHIGIVTEDFSATMEFFKAFCEIPVIHQENFQEYRVGFLDLDPTLLEVIAPTTTDTAINQFLADHGPGLHHLALQVDDVARSLDRAKSLGIECIDDDPRPGARDHTVAFLHPSSTHGVLIEFVAVD